MPYGRRAVVVAALAPSSDLQEKDVQANTQETGKRARAVNPVGAWAQVVHQSEHCGMLTMRDHIWRYQEGQSPEFEMQW